MYLQGGRNDDVGNCLSAFGAGGGGRAASFAPFSYSQGRHGGRRPRFDTRPCVWRRVTVQALGSELQHSGANIHRCQPNCAGDPIAGASTPSNTASALLYQEHTSDFQVSSQRCLTAYMSPVALHSLSGLCVHNLQQQLQVVAEAVHRLRSQAKWQTLECIEDLPAPELALKPSRRVQHYMKKLSLFLMPDDQQRMTYHAAARVIQRSWRRYLRSKQASALFMVMEELQQAQRFFAGDLAADVAATETMVTLLTKSMTSRSRRHGELSRASILEVARSTPGTGMERPQRTAVHGGRPVRPSECRAHGARASIFRSGAAVSWPDGVDHAAPPRQSGLSMVTVDAHVRHQQSEAKGASTSTSCGP
jgi:hypothetical protein